MEYSSDLRARNSDEDDQEVMLATAAVEANDEMAMDPLIR